MDRLSLRTLVPAPMLAIGIALAMSAPAFGDDDHRHGLQTTASFGRGLNTARPGNPVNHAILPGEIRIKAGGVVDFAVAGFHDIIIFKPGFSLNDLVQAGGGQIPLTAPIFVFPPDASVPLPPPLAHLTEKIYYRGLSPAGGPLATPVTGDPSNGANRTEPVAFLEKGDYLVVCNVRPHLLDGMMAVVKVD